MGVNLLVVTVRIIKIEQEEVQEADCVVVNYGIEEDLVLA